MTDTYLYWFKFLLEAELSPDFKVNWRKYRGWGGAKGMWRGEFMMPWDWRRKNR